MRRILMVSVLALTACATAEERCIDDAQDDLRVVDELIASLEEDLARGYTVRSERTSNIGIVFCTGGSNLRFCSGGSPARREVAEAISREDTEAQLSELRAKRTELQARAASDISACRAGA